MNHFYAKLFRMRNIQRWGLMRSVQSENLAEHAMITALLAQGLATIRRDIFGQPADPDYVASCALLHDAGEIITGDMPTPIKYHNPALREAYAKVEAQSLSKLLSQLPDAMQDSYRQIMDARVQSDDAVRLVHAADKLAAHIKCVEEVSAGNREFSLALKQTRQKLTDMNMPEVTYFLEHFLPSFSLTLDEQEEV